MFRTPSLESGESAHAREASAHAGKSSHVLEVWHPAAALYRAKLYQFVHVAGHVSPVAKSTAAAAKSAAKTAAKTASAAHWVPVVPGGKAGHAGHTGKAGEGSHAVGWSAAVQTAQRKASRRHH